MPQEPIIGPNRCHSCGGEYGVHSIDCETLLKETAPQEPKTAELESLAHNFELGYKSHHTQDYVLNSVKKYRRLFRAQAFREAEELASKTRWGYDGDCGITKALGQLAEKELNP